MACVNTRDQRMTRLDAPDATQEQFSGESRPDGEHLGRFTDEISPKTQTELTDYIAADLYVHF